MLISPKHKKIGSINFKNGYKPRLFSDEANVIDKQTSQQIMAVEIYNEVMIAK